jgi:hypothetical protein
MNLLKIQPGKLPEILKGGSIIRPRCRFGGVEVSKELEFSRRVYRGQPFVSPPLSSHKADTLKAARVVFLLLRVGVVLLMGGLPQILNFICRAANVGVVNQVFWHLTMNKEPSQSVREIFLPPKADNPIPIGVNGSCNAANRDVPGWLLDPSKLTSLGIVREKFSDFVEAHASIMKQKVA